MPLPIRNAEEFYAHALAMEIEAADRYAEYALYFQDRGDDVLAGLCGNLSRLERGHHEALARASRGLSLPVLAPAEYRWIDMGSPEAPARRLFYRVATPRQLLEIALLAEQRALGYFEWVARTTGDHAVRLLAREMAREEAEHVRWVRNAIEYHPDTRIDWEKLIGHGVGPGALLDSPAKPAKPARRRRKARSGETNGSTVE